MEMQKVPFYIKLLPSIFADETDKQFVVASDWTNSGSTELVYFNKSKFFYFIEKDEQNVVQKCFLVYGLQWLKNVLYFNAVINKMNNLCDVNHCSSGYEALCLWKKEDDVIKLERLNCEEILGEYFVGRKKLENIEDSLTFVKAMNEMDAFRLGSAEEFTKNPGNVY